MKPTIKHLFHCHCNHTGFVRVSFFTRHQQRCKIMASIRALPVLHIVAEQVLVAIAEPIVAKPVLVAIAEPIVETVLVAEPIVTLVAIAEPVLVAEPVLIAEEESCPICYSETSRLYQVCLNHHKTCYSCIKSMSKQSVINRSKGTCPICRSAIVFDKYD